MSVTRQSLRFKCSVKDCPWPKDEEIHVPWCLGIPDVEHWPDKPTHQHWPKKGMGGNNPKSKIIAILCPPCHDRIDNVDWGNNVKNFPGRGDVYFAWDLHGNTLIERPVLSDGAEAATSGSISNTAEGVKVIADPTPPRGSEGNLKPDSVAAHTSAPSPSAEKEEGDGQESGVPDGGVHGPDVGDTPVGDSISPIRLTHEQRVAIAQMIKDTEWNRQWIAGDTGNAWIAELGEEAEQYLSDFGYQPESLANILRVCAAIPKALRSSSLRFSHHVVVADLNREDMDEWLGTCEIEQWSVAEFRRRVKGTKPRVKRWTLGELEEAVADFEAWINTANPPKSNTARSFVSFITPIG